jgi:polyisoprenoid-binding protein YceI
MIHRYRFDARLSRFTVQASTSGMLSLLRPNAKFAVRQFEGEFKFTGEAIHHLSLNVAADSVALVDRARGFDRQEIESRMRRDVLETWANPQITFRSSEGNAIALSPGRYRVRVAGGLSLRGATRMQQLVGELIVFSDGVRLRGEFGLRMSDYRIKQVSALRGAIRLNHELKIAYDLAAALA